MNDSHLRGRPTQHRLAELGAAFLSNEAGILDSVRFENSEAYLASWIQKLESDPRGAAAIRVKELAELRQATGES